jgi:hypothetical protein
MPTNRKRQQRNQGGNISSWVHEYLKTGKPPQKNEDGYDEWCHFTLLKLNVNGLPEQPAIKGWPYHGN